MSYHFPTGMIIQTNGSNTYRYGFSSGDDGYMYIDNINLSTDEISRLQFSKNGALDLLTINDGDINYIGHFISDADLDTWVVQQFAQQQTIVAKHWLAIDTGVIIPSGKTYKVGVVVYTGNQFVFPMNVYMDSNRHIFAELSNISDSQVTVQFATIRVCYGI